MKMLICGGRDFDDWGLFTASMIDIFNQNSTAANPIDHIIAGGARGADTFARRLAKGWDLTFTEYPAKWDEFGKSAGYIRNRQMLDEGQPDLVVAFPGGKGTEMMVKIAQEAGVKVIEVRN
jgi:UDP-N-acetylmuramoylalanine-D-glutamate ligase